MKRIAQAIAVAMLIAIPIATVNASLVLDDFSNPNAASNTNVTRSSSNFTPASGGLQFGGSTGTIAGANEVFRLDYTVINGGTFEDISGMTDGFQITADTLTSDFSVQVIGFKGPGPIGAGVNGVPSNGREDTSFNNPIGIGTTVISAGDDVSLFQTLRFRIFRAVGSSGTITLGDELSIGGFSAVPEPSSMLLAGLPIGCLLMRRKRR